LIGLVKDAYNWSHSHTKIFSKQELISQSRVGDILVFLRGWKGAPGHLAIKTDRGKIQTKLSQGVKESQLGTAKLLCAIYRFKEFN